MDSGQKQNKSVKTFKASGNKYSTKFFEIYAALTLEYCFDMPLWELSQVNRDRPDLQYPGLDIGIE